MSRSPPFAASVACGLLLVLAGVASAHKYTPGSEVPVLSRGVSPFANPHESYPYSSLSLCGAAPEAATAAATATATPLPHLDLADSLTGRTLEPTSIRLYFAHDIPDAHPATECPAAAAAATTTRLQKACESQYWFLWYVSGLPVWGLVGEMLLQNPGAAQAAPYLYTHRSLLIAHNSRDEVVAVTLNVSNPVPLSSLKGHPITYSVKWVKSEVAHEDRMLRYLDRGFFGHRVHWFSAFNSVMLAVFLVGVAVILTLRTVRHEAAARTRGTNIEEGNAVSSSPDLDLGDESGWKQVAGDVFRSPASPALFSAVQGTGVQISAVMVAVVVLGFLGDGFVAEPSGPVGWFMWLYVLMSVVGGFKSASTYMTVTQGAGKRWLRAMAFTALLLPAFCGLLWFVVNTAAASHGSNLAAPFSSQVGVALLWLFGVLPLTFVGTLLGRRWVRSSAERLRSKPVNQFPGQIPPTAWYRGRLACTLLAGSLPFGAVFIELYFVFSGLWHYKFYYTYGFLGLSLLSLFAVSGAISVVVVYYLLNEEDYRWQWTSTLCGASTALYVFAYCVYYYRSKTSMGDSCVQFFFYFAVSALLSTICGYLCSAASYAASSAFVTKIFSTTKVD